MDWFSGGWEVGLSSEGWMEGWAGVGMRSE